MTYPKLPEEQQRIIDKCYHPDGGFEEFKKDEVEQSIPARFEKIVAKYPDRLAVRTETQALTYEELNQYANRVAHTTLDRLGEREEPVVVMMEKDASMIASIMGVLKAGKAYVPLEPAYFGAKTRYVVEDSQAHLIVTNNSHISMARDLAPDGCQLVNIDALAPGSNERDPGMSISPDSLAWILYTSGSTGQPKGVMQNHRNTLHLAMQAVNRYHVCPEDRVDLIPSLSFSASLDHIFEALLVGASILPYDVSNRGLIDIPRWFADTGITICNVVPTILRHSSHLMETEEGALALRIVSLAGDRVVPEDILALQRVIPSECVIEIAYGATEAYLMASYAVEAASTLQDNLMPVGYPPSDIRVLILGEQCEDLGFDNVGEIAIKSKYLALGYWKRPDLTKQKFLSDPDGGGERIYLTGDLGLMKPDGCLYHMGRKDFQVKVRGHRIELAEVESALASVPQVKEGAVVSKADDSGENRLTAYYTVTEEPGPMVSELRLALEDKLPRYMTPSVFVKMDALPQTSSGKIDRNALPEPSKERPDLATEYVAPRTPAEQVLARMWSEVLNLDQVGIYDAFMNLGGNSLLAAQVISRVLQEFQVELPLRSLMEAPTIADMALLITENRAKKASPTDLERMLQELENPEDDAPN
jgi:amino acid adenylation domain-containing protein